MPWPQSGQMFIEILLERFLSSGGAQSAFLLSEYFAPPERQGFWRIQIPINIGSPGTVGLSNRRIDSLLVARTLTTIHKSLQSTGPRLTADSRLATSDSFRPLASTSL